jgi:nitroimidazol reductase NimA-like FMN-containing flavoprotein (pyridoxamine 5'-phosphate oxidase superfamily)
MTNKEPVAEYMVEHEDAKVTPWADVRELLNKGGTYWLATVRPDGRPHVVPVGPTWVGDALYFTTGQGTVKGENLVHNAHCVLTLAASGYDLVIEGEAAKVSGEARLRPVAESYVAQGWPAYVHDGVLDAPFSAPTTGPAPYDVYEITPTVAFAFGTEEATVYSTTRYRF